MKSKESLNTQILQYIRDNPGTTGDTLQKQFRSVYLPGTISNTVSRLRKWGLIENKGPEGRRWSEWWPVIFEHPTPEFLELARGVLFGLKSIPPSERERCLALYLQKNIIHL